MIKISLVGDIGQCKTHISKKDGNVARANETILDTPLTKRTKKIKSRRDTKGRQVTTLAEDVAKVLKPKKKMTGGKVYASSIRKPKTLR